MFSSRRSLRAAYVAVLCTIGSFWFLYDGMVGYPAEREAGLNYLEFKKENEGKDELEIIEAWMPRAAENGWRQENPLDPETNEPRSEIDIKGQFYWAAIVGLLAIWNFIRFLMFLGRGE
jgi:hypothetical protein